MIEVDYTGCKFNALTVVRLVGTVKHGRNNVKVWSCACICGNELEVDQCSLVKGLKPACKDCRRGPCVICGAPVISDDWGVKRNTCSSFCQSEQNKAKHLRRYYKLIKLNPNHNKERHKARKLANPNYEINRYQLRLNRLNALSENERQAIIQKQNEYSNLWKSAYIKNLKATDIEAYERHRKATNAYFRRWYKKFKKKVSDE